MAFKISNRFLDFGLIGGMLKAELWIGLIRKCVFETFSFNSESKLTDNNTTSTTKQLAEVS